MQLGTELFALLWAYLYVRFKQRDMRGCNIETPDTQNICSSL